MTTRRNEYHVYLRSPQWLATRERKLAAAGHRCEFEECASPRDAGIRCTETTGLEVHHRHYATVGREADNDLRVLCRLHHLATHLAAIECEFCALEPVMDEDEALEIAKDAIANGDDLESIVADIDRTCPSCLDMLGKDD